MIVHDNQHIIDNGAEVMVAIRLSALGDVALTTGPLAYWHKTYGLRFHMLTKAELVPLFVNHPSVLSVIGLEKDELHGQQEMLTIKDLAKRFAQHKLVDLHCSLRSRLFRLAWKNKVFAYHKMSLERRLLLKSKGHLCGDRLKERNVPQRFCTALNKYFGVDNPPALDLRPVFFLDQTEIADLDNAFPGLPKSFVAFHPYATHKAKTWAWKNWLSLANGLIEKGFTPLWLGKGEQPPVQLPQDSINLLNRTSLRQTLAVLQRARLLVSGDSGPVLLARGVQTPVLSLEGPTWPGRDYYAPHERDLALFNPLPCRPCSLHGKVEHCRYGYACMGGIGADRVLEAALAMLA